MASSSNPKLILLLSVLISLLSISTSARPCKTLFISSYAFSIRPLYPNPNSVNVNYNNPSSSGFVTIVTEIRQKRSYSSDMVLDSKISGSDDDDSFSDSYSQRRQEGSPLLPFGLSSNDMNSLRDRTKDILSVVAALLFGVGCGALTGAIMYLVWSLFSGRYYYRYEEFDGDDEDEEEEDVNPKKFGYVKIAETEPLPKQVV